MTRIQGVRFNWYEAALEREAQRVEAGRATLGNEDLAFGWAIANIAEILDNMFVDGPIGDKPTKALFSIAHSAHTLLWSAWLDAVAGRLASASDHMRSIHESTDFMSAIHAVPDLGFAFFDGRLKTEAVRRQLLNRRKKVESHSQAVARDAQKRATDKIMEPNSHVTWSSMVVTVPMIGSPEDDSLTYVREGMNPPLVRTMCQWLAAETWVLLGICKDVFGDRPAIASLRTEESDVIDARLTELLEDAIRAEA